MILIWIINFFYVLLDGVIESLLIIIVILGNVIIFFGYLKNGKSDNYF